MHAMMWAGCGVVLEGSAGTGSMSGGSIWHPPIEQDSKHWCGALDFERYSFPSLWKLHV
jgi:hypothetical protein